MWPLLSLLSGKCIDQLLHTQAEVACKRHEVPGADGRFTAGHDLAEDPGVDARSAGTAPPPSASARPSTR